VAYHIATNVLGIFLVILAANTAAMNALLRVIIVGSPSVMAVTLERLSVRILDTVKEGIALERGKWWLVKTV